jgi:hypothetical protein
MGQVQCVRTTSTFSTGKFHINGKVFHYVVSQSRVIIVREYKIILSEHWDFDLQLCVMYACVMLTVCSLYKEFERIIKITVCRILLLIGKSLCMHFQLVL